MIKYWTGVHTKHRLLLHYAGYQNTQEKNIKGSISKRIFELLEICSEANVSRIKEMNIQPDPVHLIIQFVPDASISKLGQKLNKK